jgi:uncharacterized cupin superfamily protein
MTMKTEEGERLVTRGETVIFPTGPAGAHGFRNGGDAKCRYLVESSRQQPEVSEYPELGQITAQATTGSQTGKRLWFIHDVRDAGET